MLRLRELFIFRNKNLIEMGVHSECGFGSSADEFGSEVCPFSWALKAIVHHNHHIFVFSNGSDGSVSFFSPGLGGFEFVVSP